MRSTNLFVCVLTVLSSLPRGSNVGRAATHFAQERTPAIRNLQPSHFHFEAICLYFLVFAAIIGLQPSAWSQFLVMASIHVHFSL
jgi:hypothetical protein